MRCTLPSLSLGLPQARKDQDMTDDPRPTPRNLDQSAFSRHLGIRYLLLDPDRIEAEVLAVPELINRNGVVHGGSLMAVADDLGGMGANMNLGPGMATTTVESKTNFFRSVPAGDLFRAVSIPLHKGRTTMVWQTTITRSDGKMAAMVTQTQMTIQLRRD
jgi:1,4-dihydroxy-2-naphthoyl-CoA hydrolase